MSLNLCRSLVLLIVLLCSIVPARCLAADESVYPDRKVGEIYKVVAEGKLRAGFGEASITPDWPVQLSYGRQDLITEYYDKVKTKVMVLQVEGVKVAWVECDVIGIRQRDAEYIKGKIAEKTGLDSKHIIVGATHSHSYPRAYKEKIRNFMADQSAEAAASALDNMFDAQIGIGKTKVREDLNLNRAELHGLTNSLLYVIRIDDTTSHLKGIHFNYGTHPTIYTCWGPDDGQIGPEWPGYVSRYVELRKHLDLLAERYSKKNDIDVNPFVMFSEGTAGDQQPRLSDMDIHGEVTDRKIVFAEKLAWEVLDLADRIETTATVSMTFRSKIIALPKKDGGERLTLLQSIVINDTVIATIPGELGIDLGFKFENESPYEKNILVTVSDDYLGYIPPEHILLEKVTYQSKGDWLHPHYGVQIIDESLSMINPDHKHTPPLDPEKIFGKISGKIYYEGKNTIAVGVKRIPSPPGYGGGFWGKRTLISEDGSWEIDELAPGTFYLFLVETDPKDPEPKKLKSDFKDIRRLIYGYPVVVEAQKETKHVDFHIPVDFGRTDVKSIALKEGSLALDGYSLSGSLVIEGQLAPNESIQVGVYPAKLNYKKVEIFLANPIVSTSAARDGTFKFESLPPGRYRIGCILDVNDNSIVEGGIDVIFSPTQSPAIKVAPEDVGNVFIK